jgi:hypothetical protein
MMQGMGSMMAWMMGLGWLAGLLVIVFLVAIVVLLVQLSRRANDPGPRPPGAPPK